MLRYIHKLTFTFTFYYESSCTFTFRDGYMNIFGILLFTCYFLIYRCVRVEVSAMDVSVEKLITAICNMFSCMITLNKNIGTSLVMDPGSMYCLTAMLDTSNGME